MEPADVAREALEALGKRDIIIPGAMNRLASFFMRRIMTRKAAVSIMESSAKQLYGKG